MSLLKNIIILSMIILSSCMNPDSSASKSAGNWVGEGDYNGKAFQFGFSGVITDDRVTPVPMVQWYRSL